MLSLLTAVLFFALQNPPTAVPPINSVGVATGCNNTTIPCTYTDVAVKAGPHFYFIVAQNSVGYSGPSNRVDVTVPTGTHNVVLKWNPSSGTPAPTYFIYRGSTPTNLQATPQ